jgi:hypothetical protein
MAAHLFDQRYWNLGQVDNLRGDRAQKQALNAAKAASPHHDVLNLFLASYLRYRFGRLSGPGERFKGDVGTFGFSYRVLQSLSRCSRGCLL